MPKSLPSQPSLEHLKAQARELLASFRAKNPEALATVQSYFPDASDLKLSHAQLAIAREYGFSSWAKLKSYVESRPAPDSTSLSEAVMAQNLAEARRLLDEGAEPNDDDSLYESMSARSPELMVLLLERGARLETEGNALARLLDFEKPDWLTTALTFVEDPKALPPVLGHALRRGRSATVFQILLDFGVDPNVPDSAGKTPYQSATRLGRTDVAALLERAGADTALSPTDSLLGRLARGEAVGAISPEEIETLDAETPPALTILAERGQTRAMEALLKAGANPNIGQPHGTPLHQAALNGHVETVKVLLDHGADAHWRDPHYRGNALGWACAGSQGAPTSSAENYVAIVEILADRGVPLPEKAWGSPEVQVALIARGAAPG